MRPGWNQVGNPSLRTAWWPAARAGAGYAQGGLKGLHLWDAGAGAYAPADSLPPWKGAFAYWGGAADTVIGLLPAPRAAGSKRGAGFRCSAHLTLGGADLEIGSQPWADDGIGVEDEPVPPALGDGTRLWSRRGQARLGTDMLHWDPAGIASWTVVAGTRASDAGAELRIGSVDAPEGYGFWAVRPERGMRQPMAPGGIIPMPAGAEDSVRIVAGPLARLRAEYGGLAARIGGFGIDIRSGGARPVLSVRTPGDADIRWETWTASGRRIGGGKRRLSEGAYILPLVSSWPAGPAWVRVEWACGGRTGGFTRRLPVR